MNNVKRLNKYLEVVRNNMKSAEGSLKEFWQREEKKTMSKIARL